MRMLEKILDEFIQAYLHVLKTDVLMTSRAGELINTSLDDFIKPWCERIRFMKDTAVQAETAVLREALEQSCVCGAVEARKAVMIPTGTWEFCLACKALATTSTVESESSDPPTAS